MTADIGAKFTHARHHRAEIDFGFAWERNAEWDTVLCVIGRARRAEDAFRRHAADVETIAAQKITLDKRDFRAQTGSARRADQARGAAADHHQIVFFRRQRILSSGRDDNSRCNCLS